MGHTHYLQVVRGSIPFVQVMAVEEQPMSDSDVSTTLVVDSWEDILDNLMKADTYSLPCEVETIEVTRDNFKEIVGKLGKEEVEYVYDIDGDGDLVGVLDLVDLIGFYREEFYIPPDTDIERSVVDKKVIETLSEKVEKLTEEVVRLRLENEKSAKNAEPWPTATGINKIPESHRNTR